MCIRDRHEIDAAVIEASTILGLGDYLDRRPKALSGGQRQRVAMGRAIVRKPRVFLFDEPLSNLDAKLRTVMRKEVKLLHQRLKTTSIYVTHDQTEAMTMADKIVVMNDGLIEQIGSPMDLYNSPNNLFVAEFIGAPQMNLLSGVAETEATSTVIHLSVGAAVSVPGVSLQPGQSVQLGIRPEHLSVVPGGALNAVVDIVEPMGNETHLSCSADNTELRLVEDAAVTFRPGDRVALGFDASKAHVFDRNSGQRLLPD